MKRFELLQARERKKLSERQLRAEYASLHRSLTTNSGTFRRLLDIKKRLRGGAEVLM